MVEIVKNILKLRNNPHRIAVALSGGVDSIVLTEIFFQLLKSNFISSLICIHFNHNLRGAESDRDEEFVKRYCFEREIPIKIIQLNVNQYCKDLDTMIKKDRLARIKKIHRANVFYFPDNTWGFWN